MLHSLEVIDVHTTLFNYNSLYYSGKLWAKGQLVRTASPEHFTASGGRLQSWLTSTWLTSQGAKGKGSQSEDRWMKGFERWIMHTGSWYKVNISYLLPYGTKSKTLNCKKLWQERNQLCESLGFELKRKKKEVESQDESEYRPTHWFPPRVNQHKIWWCLNYS